MQRVVWMLGVSVVDSPERLRGEVMPLLLVRPAESSETSQTAIEPREWDRGLLLARADPNATWSAQDLGINHPRTVETSQGLTRA